MNYFFSKEDRPKIKPAEGIAIKMIILHTSD
jgi:hypothetical protein